MSHARSSLERLYWCLKAENSSITDFQNASNTIQELIRNDVISYAALGLFVEADKLRCTSLDKLQLTYRDLRCFVAFSNEKDRMDVNNAFELTTLQVTDDFGETTDKCFIHVNLHAFAFLEYDADQMGIQKKSSPRASRMIELPQTLKPKVIKTKPAIAPMPSVLGPPKTITDISKKRPIAVSGESRAMSKASHKRDFAQLSSSPRTRQSTGTIPKTAYQEEPIDVEQEVMTRTGYKTTGENTSGESHDEEDEY